MVEVAVLWCCTSAQPELGFSAADALRFARLPPLRLSRSRTLSCASLECCWGEPVLTRLYGFVDHSGLQARTICIVSCTVTPMPRPISGNQLDKLGKRLAQHAAISDEDYELLARVAEFYQAVTDKVQERLQALGLEPTTRGFKSTATMVDKLRRTHLPLKDIQDLGGARIVIDGDRLAQDRVVERIMRAFQDFWHP